MPFLLLFIVLPLLEILTFITVGDAIGGWNTLLLTICTSIAGVLVIKLQGALTLAAVRESLARSQTPMPEILDGFIRILAGIALIVPGFLTDTIGLLLLFPPTRALIRLQVLGALVQGRAGAVLHSHIGGRFHQRSHAQHPNNAAQDTNQSPRSTENRFDQTPPPQEIIDVDFERIDGDDKNNPSA